jgi:hypothetical protein
LLRFSNNSFLFLKEDTIMSTAKTVFLATMAAMFDATTEAFETLTPGQRMTFEDAAVPSKGTTVLDAVLSAHAEATPDRFTATRLGRSPGVSVVESPEARKERMKAAKVAARAAAAAESAEKDAKLAALEAQLAADSVVAA